MKKTLKKMFTAGMIMIFGLLISSCGGTDGNNARTADGRLKIAATTTFVGETVARVGGEQVELTVLLEPGQNPHAYQPTPQDLARVADARLLFVNGFQLEGFVDDLVASAGRSLQVVEVSEGIDPLLVSGDGHDHEHEEEAEHDHDEETGHDHQEEAGHEKKGSEFGQDPHVWFDPNNVILWVDNVADALAEADPAHAEDYQQNAEAYRQELLALDSWIRETVAEIPSEDRKLVTDHTAFGYFVEEYGFQQVGAVTPAPTTEAETSGKQLAELIDLIRSEEVKAIFVGMDFDPTLSERVAEDTGVELVPLYFGSLTQGGNADTYLEFMRYNVEAIVEALQ